MKKIKIIGIAIVLLMVIQVESIAVNSMKDESSEIEPSMYISYKKPLPMCLYIADNLVSSFFVTLIFGDIEMIAQVDPQGEVLEKVNFIIDGVTVASFDPHPSQMYYFNWTKDIELPSGLFAFFHYIELNVELKDGYMEYGFPALRFF